MASKKWTFEKIIWAIVTCLGLFMVIMGVLSLTLPRGQLSQKLIALIFFLVLFLFSVYKLFQDRIPSWSYLSKEWFENISMAVVSFAFVICGLFMLFQGSKYAQIIGAICILFFGLGVIVFIKKYIEK